MADAPDSVPRTARGGPFNWLEWLDQHALALEQAWSWLEPYDPFMLVRYPWLQPDSSIRVGGEPWPSRQLFLEPIESFLPKVESVADLRAILDRPELEEHSRRQQLACLILMGRDELAEHSNQQAMSRNLHDLAQNERQVEQERDRVSVKSLRVAITALQAILKLGQPQTSTGAGALENPIRQEDDIAQAAGKALTILLSVTPSKRYRELEQFRNTKLREGDRLELNGDALMVGPSSGDPRTFVMVRLYWFFKHGCGLSGNLSEISTGRVRNAFWTPDDPVQIQDVSIDDQGRGCGAVWQAVRAFRLET